MKRKTVIANMAERLLVISLLLCYTLMLWGCSGVDTDTKELISESITEPPQTEPRLQVSNSSSPEETVSWLDAYYDIMSKEGGTHIQLVDLDFDQIPELLFSQLGTGSTWIYQGYSFHEGQISEIKIPDERIPMDLELYEDKKNNRLIWLASGMFRSGSTCTYEWDQIDFHDYSDVRKTPFFEWKEILEGPEPCMVTYQLRKEDGSYQDTTLLEIDEYKKELFSNYERQDHLTMFSFVKEFENNKELFLSFAQMYDTIKKANSMEHKSGFSQMPIYSVDNQNLYNDYQNSDVPVSIVRMGYTRQDEAARTDIKVKYVQLSRFSDQNLQMELNDKLKAEAFGQWDVEREEGLELEVNQIPSVYQNYLSVKTVLSCYPENAAHPWQDVSAVTFDLKTGREVFLTDMIQVDDRLKAKIEAGMFRCDRLSHESCVEMGMYDTLWDRISSSTQGQSYPFYLTEHTLGVPLGVSHSMGDSITFEIPFHDINDLMCQ